MSEALRRDLRRIQPGNAVPAHTKGNLVNDEHAQGQAGRGRGRQCYAPAVIGLVVLTWQLRYIKFDTFILLHVPMVVGFYTSPVSQRDSSLGTQSLDDGRLLHSLVFVNTPWGLELASS